MRIAITADWHARGKDLPDLKKQLDALVGECQRREIEVLAVLGDIFEHSQIGDSYASTGAIVEVVAKPIAEWLGNRVDLQSRCDRTVLMIPGNHDVSGAGSADALHVFDGVPRITVARNLPLTVLSRTLMCLPWNWGSERTPEQILSDAPMNEQMLLFAHVEVIGARMGGVQCCEVKPGKWQISREFLESLPVAHVALGHFHTRQDLTGGRGGYVGALRQLNFGEEGNPAGFEIFDTETRETEWVELDAAPTYRTVEVSNPNLMPGKRTNEHLRIRYVGTQPIDPSVIAELERNEDTQLEVIVPRQERIQRAEVPAGIADDPHGLIGLWAGTQNPPVEAAPLNQMYDRVHADAEA